jgi:hypothetical protein
MQGLYRVILAIVLSTAVSSVLAQMLPDGTLRIYMHTAGGQILIDGSNSQLNTYSPCLEEQLESEPGPDDYIYGYISTELQIKRQDLLTGK